MERLEVIKELDKKYELLVKFHQYLEDEYKAEDIQGMIHYAKQIDLIEDDIRSLKDKLDDLI